MLVTTSTRVKVSILHRVNADPLVAIACSFLEHLDGATHVTVDVVDHEGAIRTVCALPDSMLPMESDFDHGGPALTAFRTGGMAHFEYRASQSVMA